MKAPIVHFAAGKCYGWSAFWTARYPSFQGLLYHPSGNTLSFIFIHIYFISIAFRSTILQYVIIFVCSAFLERRRFSICFFIICLQCNLIPFLHDNGKHKLATQTQRLLICVSSKSVQKSNKLRITAACGRIKHSSTASLEMSTNTETSVPW